VRELQHQIQVCDQLYIKHRRSKQPVLPLVDDSDPSHALRTSAMVKPKKPRKLCRKAPTTLSTRVAIFDGADTHPLFSFPGIYYLLFNLLVFSFIYYLLFLLFSFLLI
jgi:hypothetical protein